MTATLESIKKMVGKKNDSKAFVWLADYERREGSLDAAIHRLDAGLEKFPNDLSALIVRSAVLFDQEKWGETLELCERILRRDPYVLSVLYRAGFVCEKLDRIPERNLFFLRLHDLDPLDSFWQEEYADLSGLESLAPEFEQDENDPFGAITALLPEEQEEESINFEQLQSDLGDAFSTLDSHADSNDSFIGEDISGEDISSAFSGFFGSSDDLKEEPEEPAAPMSVFSSFAQEKAASGRESEIPPAPAALDLPEEESSASASSAFDQLFGDDDTLEESSILPPPIPAAETEPVAETPLASTADTLNDFFGDDELPDEPAQYATPAAEVPEVPNPNPATAAAIEPPAEKEESSGKIELTSEVASSFDALFGDEDDDDWSIPVTPAATAAPSAAPETAPVSNEEIKSDISSSFDSIFGDDELPEVTSSVKAAGTFETLFEKSAESAPPAIGAERSGVDFLMSGDSDDEVENALIQNPHAKLDAGNVKLDENLNTPTLADIYYEQGLYKESLDIYRDLAKREPDNAEIQNRLAEVEAKYNESNKDA